MGVVAWRVGVVELAADDVDHLLDGIVESRPAAVPNRPDNVLMDVSLECAALVHRPCVLGHPLTRRYLDGDLLQPRRERGVVPQAVVEFTGLFGQRRVSQPDCERTTGAAVSSRSDFRVDLFCSFVISSDFKTGTRAIAPF